MRSTPRVPRRRRQQFACQGWKFQDWKALRDALAANNSDFSCLRNLDDLQDELDRRTKLATKLYGTSMLPQSDGTIYVIVNWGWDRFRPGDNAEVIVGNMVKSLGLGSPDNFTFTVGNGS